MIDRTTVADAVAPPTGNPRFPAVDGLRALAALGVVAYHANQYAGSAADPLGHIAGHLDIGVAIFFAITGFLLYRPFVAAAVGDAPHTPTWVFYWRRIVRIVPAYWVALLVLAPAIISYAHPAALGNILFLQIYKPGWVRSGIPPAWSVCVEMSFYLLLPSFAALAQRWWSRHDREGRCRCELSLVGSLAIGSLIIRALVAHYVPNKYWLDLVPNTLPWFCVGMSLAVLSVQDGRASNWIAAHAWWCWAGALLLFATLVPAKPSSVEAANITLFIRYGLIAGLVLAPLVMSCFTPVWVMSHNPLSWLGLISYGVYLYHDPIMNHIAFSGSPTVRLLLDGVVGAVVAIACGAGSYYLIERQALKLKRIDRIQAASRLACAWVSRLRAMSR